MKSIISLEMKHFQEGHEQSLCLRRAPHGRTEQNAAATRPLLNPEGFGPGQRSWDEVKGFPRTCY